MIKKEINFDAVLFNTVRDIINNCITKYGEKTAFILKHKINKEITYEKITYKHFGDDITALGTALLKSGYAGKRIAIIGKNSYPWLLGYFAAINGVGVAVPLDKGLTFEELESSLIRSCSDVIIFDKEQEEIIKKIKENNRTQISLYLCMDACFGYANLDEFLYDGYNAINNGDDSFSKREIIPDNMSILLFTSGTTSMAKAVMLSHKNIASNIFGLHRAIEILPDDVNMAFLPFHHTFGCTGIMLFLSKGITNVFCDGLKYIAKNLQEYKVSIFVCVPLLLEAMYKKILVQAEKQGKLKLLNRMTVISNFLLKFGIDLRKKFFKSVIAQMGGHMRFVVSGASGIDREVVKGFNDLGITTIQGYGLTETSPVLTAERPNRIRYGSIGYPLCNVEVKIDNPNEKGIGEVIAKGPNIMIGYYENPEETSKVIKNGWFYTGDLAYFDKDGFLFLCGRKKNVIILKNGKNIFPEEIEILVNNLPYVSESMVFGMEKGNDLIISAEIVYNVDYVNEILNNISKKELESIINKDIDELNDTLPSYKHIKRLFITDEPTIKTTTSKIKRYEEIKKIIALE